MDPSQSDRAKLFHRLHADGLLLLANVCDAGEARLVESLGAQAIATTSAGVAWSHGYADGGHLPVRLTVATVERIARVIRLPLSVDLEAGFSDDPVTVGENVAAVIGVGAVGINLEDGTGSPDLLCAKIGEVRCVGERLGVKLFINARTDTYLRGTFPPERRVEETLARAARYRAAGADGLFVVGLVDPAEIRVIAGAVGLPLNVVARPGMVNRAELAAAGVRRLSAGSGIAEALFGRTAMLAAEFLHTGKLSPENEGAMAYRDVNALMTGQ